MKPVHIVSERISLRADCDRAELTLPLLQEWSRQLGVAIHIAVMVEPYLSKVCSGEKYIESRLTKVNISPFRRAGVGDVIVFKRSGGPVCAVAEISAARFESLGRARRPEDIADEFQAGLGYEPGYIESKAEAQFATLLWLECVQLVPRTPLSKSGRQAWVTLSPSMPTAGSDLEPSCRLF